MIAFIHSLLDTSPPLLVFTIIGLGFFLGQIKIFGFHLNVAAILFVGIAFGVWDSTAFLLPEELYIIGLMLFVYSIGLQSGPTFFEVFREKGFKLNLLAFLTLLVAFLTTLIMGRLFHIPSELLSGVFAGSMTNTPSLAAATDAIRNLFSNQGLPLEVVAQKISAPTLGYSVTYPFGVIGVILAMQLVSKLFHVSFKKEREEYQKQITEKQSILVKEFLVTNPAFFGKKLGESHAADLTGLVFTRMKHGEFISLAVPESILHENDVLVGVGVQEGIEKAALIVGPLINSGVIQISPKIEYRDLFVNDKKMVGRQVWDVNIDHEFGAVVSRVRRGFTQLPIDHKTTIEFGDQIRVVTYAENMDRVCSLFGSPIQDLNETDFLSISLGMIMGILLGMLPIPLPNGTALHLGFAGGPLIVALILGRLGRTGPIIWTIPTNANLTIRQLGLYLFLAGIGVKAGGGFVSLLQNEGLYVLLAGACVTLSSSVFALVVGFTVFKIEMITLLGLVSGIHTQPACLAFAGELSESTSPNLYYAAVQPLSMVMKIILAQLIVLSF